MKIISKPYEIGNSVCETSNNIKECGYDGGDCCEIGDKNDNILNLGDGLCHAGYFNTQACNYDNGDCFDFRRRYPACPDFLDHVSDEQGQSIVIGDGMEI